MKLALAVLVALAVVGSACGGAPTQQPPPVAHATVGQLYVTTAADQALWVVDTKTGTVARTMPAATPAPDWRALYRLADGGLHVLDPLTGRVVATHPAPGWAQIVRTSASGRWLVLAESDPGGRFQVQDAAWTAAPVNVALPGAFTFDGISGDGQRLYLLERLTAGRYQVRMYDVRHGALAPYVIVEKSEIGQPMSGTALASYTTRGDAMQLTLYQRDEHGKAFIHALPIDQESQWAFCVDLPGPPSGWAFAPAPDGHRFYAVNPGSGQVIELDSSQFGPPEMRQRTFGAVRAEDPVATVSADGKTLFAGTDAGVIAIDAGTLRTRATGLQGRSVTALAAGPDGGVLYAVTGATRLVRIDPKNLAVAGEITTRGALSQILRAT